MEDKTFQLLEKIYTELLDFKEEVSNKFDKMDGRLRKIEIGQEELKDKVTEAFEAIDTLAETNNRQHEEIIKELKGDIGVIELAVRRIAK